MAAILLNDNLISPAAQRGIARYFGKMVDSTISFFGREAIICSSEQRNYGLARHVRSVRFRGSWRIGLQDKFAAVLTRLERPAVVYSAYYGSATFKAAQVFTVYDMMHEMFAPPSHPFIAQKRRCLQRAAALLAISANTARDITAIYPDVDPAKIHITPLGVDEFFFQAGNSQPAVVDQPYFLYVGHRTPYKNFLRLLEAFGQAGLGKQFALKVISPQSNTFSAEEIECISRHHLQDKVHLVPSPSDEALRDHYHGAAAFVYPSTYEGFGLPVLEAMASGTLVAASNVASLPEVGGEVAFYCDPNSTPSVAECLVQIANLSPEARRQRISQGIDRARTFTWERCQWQTMEIFSHLATRGSKL